MTDFNLSNFTTDWTYYGFKVYQGVFFGIFWDIFFIMIGVYIYIQSDKNTFQTAIYLFGAWALFGGVFSLATFNILGMIVAMIFTGLFISKIGEKRRWWG